VLQQGELELPNLPPDAITFPLPSAFPSREGLISPSAVPEVEALSRPAVLGGEARVHGDQLRSHAPRPASRPAAAVRPHRPSRRQRARGTALGARPGQRHGAGMETRPCRNLEPGGCCSSCSSQPARPWPPSRVSRSGHARCGSTSRGAMSRPVPSSSRWCARRPATARPGRTWACARPGEAGHPRPSAPTSRRFANAAQPAADALLHKYEQVKAQTLAAAVAETGT